jgi:diguanylate cyclase
MDGGAAAENRLPVAASPYGLFFEWQWRVHELAHYGQAEQALIEADRYAYIAGLFGDERTIDFLLQGRMFARKNLGRHAEALDTAQELVARQRAAGNVVGEAKTLAALADLYLLTGRFAESMRCLARAGLLLETPRGPVDRYVAAWASYADAAHVAGLYEAADAAYQRVREGDLGSYLWSANHPSMLTMWALRLTHLGHHGQASRLLRRVLTLTAEWTERGDDADDPEQAEARRAMRGFRALAAAKLGDTDQAIALARPLVAASPAPDLFAAFLPHLALGVAHHARGEHADARRELLAAQEFSRGEHTEVVLAIEYELATVTADALGAPGRELLTLLRHHAQQLWQERLNRQAMLTQARQREESDIDRAASHAALLRDALTGLGNRRHYDHLTTAIDTGERPPPVSLLVIDVDNFKTINDAHSHSAGDQVLRELAAIFRGHCRAGIDTPIRYAGDEFTIFLHADLAAAVDIANRIRAAVAATDFGEITPGTPVSISTGVAVLRPGMTSTDLFATADANLYQAKQAGRDRVAA